MYLAVPVGVTPLEFHRNVRLAPENYSPRARITKCCLHDNTLSRFDRTLTCDTQTDGQTDTGLQHIQN